MPRLEELGCYCQKRAAGEPEQITEDVEIKLKEERNFLKKKIRLLETRLCKLKRGVTIPAFKYNVVG